MKKETISEAIGGISMRHIREAGDCAVAENTDLKSRAGKRTAFGRRFLRVAAASAVLMAGIMVCVSTPAVAEPIKGYFHDIMRWDGAVVGLVYENATNEIQIDAGKAVSEDGRTVLPLSFTLLDQTKEPYRRAMEEIALGDYRVLDPSGNEAIAASGQQEEIGSLEGGRASLVQTFDAPELLAAGKYTLVIESVYGLKKAEQPLRLEGHWECVFTVEP